MLKALARHWPEYVIEAFCLGTFMISAALFCALLQHPASPVRQAIGDPLVRRALMGLAMGTTAVALITSPLGRRSGAHMNPAVTLTFLYLRKIGRWDALFYALSQVAGGVAGVLLAALVLGNAIADPSIGWVATKPGPRGPVVAFTVEFLMSFGMMATVLAVSNHPRLARYTGLCAGFLVANYIAWLDPFSGMSINPARTLASALPSRSFDALWVYLTAPPLGMLAAAALYLELKGWRAVHCAKLDHHGHQRCIFACGSGVAAAA